MPGRLTTTELACVRAAGEGLQDKEIARRLHIRSHRTVQRHLSEAYRKLGVSDRWAAVAVVRRDYADLPIPISELAAAPASRPGPVETPGLETTPDQRPWLARVWRAPPRQHWLRLGLIGVVAVLWILLLGGSLAMIEGVFEATDRFRPPHGGEVP